MVVPNSCSTTHGAEHEPCSRSHERASYRANWEPRLPTEVMWLPLYRLPWERRPFLLPYTSLLRVPVRLALPAFPGPLLSAGECAHGIPEPVWPAAGSHGASQPQLPGPAGAGQLALGAAGCGPVPAPPSGPGMRTQAPRAAGILRSGPVGCPTLSLGAALPVLASLLSAGVLALAQDHQQTWSWHTY